MFSVNSITAMCACMLCVSADSADTETDFKEALYQTLHGRCLRTDEYEYKERPLHLLQLHLNKFPSFKSEAFSSSIFRPPLSIHTCAFTYSHLFTCLWRQKKDRQLPWLMLKMMMKWKMKYTGGEREGRGEGWERDGRGEGWEGRGMGGERDGRGEGWEGRGMGGERDGRGEGWEGRGMGGERDGRGEGWEGRGMGGERDGRGEGWEGRGMGGERDGRGEGGERRGSGRGEGGESKGRVRAGVRDTERGEDGMEGLRYTCRPYMTLAVYH